jgi:hypothetical protein
MSQNAYNTRSKRKASTSDSPSNIEPAKKTSTTQNPLPLAKNPHLHLF